MALVFTSLFLAGLVPVTMLGGDIHFPSPLQPPEEVVSYFQTEPGRVRLCAFLQFASSIPLGIFTATMVSRLRFLGVTVAGPSIAQFGGLAASSAVAGSSLVQWVLAQPGIADDIALTRALHFLTFAVGGPGYSVPLGLLIAGLSVPSFFFRLLPRWLCLYGLVLSLVGELSTLSLAIPGALFLIPLTRFPGFLWLIFAGSMLPHSPPGDSRHPESSSTGQFKE